MVAESLASDLLEACVDLVQVLTSVMSLSLTAPTGNSASRSYPVEGLKAPHLCRAAVCAQPEPGPKGRVRGWCYMLPDVSQANMLAETEVTPIASFQPCNALALVRYGSAGAELLPTEATDRRPYARAHPRAPRCEG
jgi:hypothetical protein